MLRPNGYLAPGTSDAAAERGGLTPAIAMSGAIDLETTLDAGFHFHLTKPVPAQALLEAIRSFVRHGEASHESWSLAVEDDTIVIRFDGHVSAGDMRAMTEALVPLLEASGNGSHVVSDLRRLSSFTSSVGAVAQLGVWRVREKIRSVTVVGGSTLARAISRGACAVLGRPCTLSAALPK